MTFHFFFVHNILARFRLLRDHLFERAAYSVDNIFSLARLYKVQVELL